jgi:hypothetical protein
VDIVLRSLKGEDTNAIHIAKILQHELHAASNFAIRILARRERIIWRHLGRPASLPLRID